MKDRIAMSQRERDLLHLLKPVLDGDRTQAEAARLAGLSVRQVRRILARLRDEGDAGVVHRLRGRPSNRRVDPERRRRALQRYGERLDDFGPTLAAEVLAEEGIEVSPHTLRRWLVADGLWKPKTRRKSQHLRRPRRQAFGELVQVDASVHRWLEGRGDDMVLLAMIDDATSRVMTRFHHAETTDGYFRLFREWLRAHGRPLALYTDKRTCFRNPVDPDLETQFARACAQLDVQIIAAHSPQAKGRVERLFGTAQDRWVKRMRLDDVMTMTHANDVLRRSLQPHFNKTYAVKPDDRRDAHRPLGPDHDLDAVLCPHHQRVVARDGVVRFQNRLFEILNRSALRRGREVTVEQRAKGRLVIRQNDRQLPWRELPDRQQPTSAIQP